MTKMNRKSKLILIVAAVAVLLGVLIFVNRTMSKSAAQLYSEGSFTLVSGGKQQVITAADYAKLPQETFSVKFRRQVGDPIDREYTGVALSEILALAGDNNNEGGAVSISALDNYTVELTLEEACLPQNAYIVTMQDGEPLDEQSGVYMLVVRGDERATRWIKQLATIKQG